jgi:lauroyl/myristoyl acyltransferase
MQLAGAGRETTLPVRPALALPEPPTRRQRLQFRAFVAAESLVGRLSPATSRRIAAAVGKAALTVAPHRFDGLRANLRHVLPDATEAELRRVLRANVANLMRAWAEVLAMPTHGDALAARVHPVNVENMTGPQERGRGVVIASLHLGSWEVGLACWNRRFGSMSLLAEVLRPPELFEHVVASRALVGIKVIPIDTAAMREADQSAARRLGAAALRDVVRTLRGNGLVAMAMDRDLIGNGDLMDFFGAHARIPVGVVDVAIRTGAAIVPVFLIRAGDEVIAPCFPEIPYDADAPREAEVRRVSAEVLRIFETIIREHPDQWHVLDPIWDAEVVRT